MKKILYMIGIAVLSMMTFSNCDKETISPTESAKYQTFNDVMRKLWSDHAIGTRNVIINVMDGMSGTNEVINRLLQNQADIGNAIKPYYGDTSGDALTDLLKVNITTAATLLIAAKTADTESFNSVRTAWYANAEEIAVFLNTVNPDHFPLASMKSMIKELLDLTFTEAMGRLEGNYPADIAAFDKVYEHIMKMADTLAEGIANQFPDKFN